LHFQHALFLGDESQDYRCGVPGNYRVGIVIDLVQAVALFVYPFGFSCDFVADPDLILPFLVGHPGQLSSVGTDADILVYSIFIASLQYWISFRQSGFLLARYIESKVVGRPVDGKFFELTPQHILEAAFSILLKFSNVQDLRDDGNPIKIGNVFPEGMAGIARIIVLKINKFPVLA